MARLALRKFYSFVCLCITLSFIQSSYADINFRFNGDCDELAGFWHGNGHIDAWLIKCDYSGEGTITGSDQFSIDLTFNRSGGSSLCPNERKQQLKGTCSNGELRIDSDDVTLTGTMENNNKAVLTGEVRIIGISAGLDVDLER